MPDKFAKLEQVVEDQRNYGITFHCGYKAKKPDGTEFPQSQKTYRPDGHFSQRYTQKYGDTNKLRILFPDTDIRDVAQVFVEYRNKAGVLMGRAFIDWWGDKHRTFEARNIRTGKREIVTEDTLDRSIEEHGLTGRETLKITFMLEKFVAEGTYCLCQLYTRGIDSSIPTMLNTLRHMRNRLSFPFDLSLNIAENRGIKNDGTTRGQKFPVVELHPISDEEAVKSLQQSIVAYAQIQAGVSFMTALSIKQASQKILLGGNGTALNAASEADESRARLICLGDSCCERIRELTTDDTILKALTAWDDGKHKWDMTKLDQMVNKLLAKEEELSVQRVEPEDVIETEPVNENNEATDVAPEEQSAFDAGPVKDTTLGESCIILPSFDKMMQTIRDIGSPAQITKAEKAIHATPVDEDGLGTLYHEVIGE